MAPTRIASTSAAYKDLARKKESIAYPTPWGGSIAGGAPGFKRGQQTYSPVLAGQWLRGMSFLLLPGRLLREGGGGRPANAVRLLRC